MVWNGVNQNSNGLALFGSSNFDPWVSNVSGTNNNYGSNFNYSNINPTGSISSQYPGLSQSTIEQMILNKYNTDNWLNAYSTAEQLRNPLSSKIMNGVFGGFQALSGLANAYNGYKQMKLAKDMYDTQTNLLKKQYNDQVQQHNNALTSSSNIGLALAGSSITDEDRARQNAEVEKRKLSNFA